MKRKIYFCGSIRGGREDALLYGKVIRLMQETEEVLTEHIGNVHYSAVPRTPAGECAIYEQDIAWLRESDLVIAECSTPSLGVGYELAYAENLGKPVYVFCRGSVALSAMISGDPFFKVYRYDTEQDLLNQLQALLRSDAGPN